MRKRRVVTTLIVVVLILVAIGFRLVERIGYDRGPADRFAVIRVFDGDTAELTGGDQLRLLGIDTPERDEPLHDQAAALLSSLAMHHRCRIEFNNSRRDHYGRLLGYLYVDSMFVNRVIVDSGYAYVYLFSDNDNARPEIKELLDAQRSAITRHVGLWGIPHEPEDHYISPVGSFRLHRPNCPALGPQREGHYRTFATREEGLATGLSPCRTCKP